MALPRERRAPCPTLKHFAPHPLFLSLSRFFSTVHLYQLTASPYCVSFPFFFLASHLLCCTTSIWLFNSSLSLSRFRKSSSSATTTATSTITTTTTFAPLATLEEYTGIPRKLLAFQSNPFYLLRPFKPSSSFFYTSQWPLLADSLLLPSTEPGCRA